MKAVVYTNYGSPDVLRLEDVDQPVPGDHEVLVKVYATSANAADWRRLTANPFLVRLADGLFKPTHTILGSDVAGRVEAVGPGVTLFQPGDDVYGDLSECGLGGYAEYVVAPESMLAPKPAALTYDEASAVPMAAVTALQGLRDQGKLQPGQTVAINGASGGVGTFAVQIAKALGAEVTAVCSPRSSDLARSLGADHVIDYTKEDFTKGDRRYDLILAVNGYHSIWDYRRALNPGGIYVMVGASAAAQLFEALLLGPWISMTGSQKMGALTARPSRQDLLFLNGLFEARTLAPVIDRRYPLAETADAIRYVLDGHARGKVVVTVAQ